LDALILSRIQFGLSVGFHYLFPATTIGLTFYILIIETIYLRTKKDIYRQISDFMSRLLSLVFGMGVATGMLLPFSFGTNWSGFSIFSSNIFGAQLAIEAITAFSVESIALAVMLFGRSRVSKQVYWVAVFLVCAASHLSGFWIVSANSWMQTPAGYIIENGVIKLLDFWAAIFNPSTIVRFCHVIIAGWITGAVVVCAIAASYLIRNTFTDFAKKMIAVSIILLIATPLLELAVGHFHIMEVLETQPAKNSAYEGMFFKQRGAPLYLFGIPDAQNKTIHFGIAIPKFLSFLESFNFDSEVHGLEEYDQSTLPPVNVIFTTFHLMVGVGMILIGVGLVGLFLFYTKKLFSTRWYLWILMFIAPLPYLANEMGWIGAEIGRQPWIVYNILRTSGAVSPNVTFAQAAFSLSTLTIVYAFLFISFIMFFTKLVKTGPMISKQTEAH
jgi:cytochrome d ubiquinol oxidase subunit I